MCEDIKIEKHESFGALQISRRQHSTTLFGSSIKHNHTIVLRITSAEMQRNLHSDWLHPSASTKDIYAEVEMSYTQFAESITSINQGTGIPVTVRYANGREMEPCPFTSKDEQFRAEFESDLAEVALAVDSAVDRVKALFESKKPLNKAEKDELLSVLRQLSTDVKSNIPFIRDSFVEQMDKTVTEAKGNIEGFIQHRMSGLAQEALAQSMASMGGASALLGLGETIKEGGAENNE